MNRVEELRQVYADMERLKEREQALSVPFVTNTHMISNFYDVFTVSLKRIAPDASPMDTASRKIFLYAILYLFSPATLTGKIIRHKMRECLSSVMMCTPTGVSKDYKTAIFFYVTYKGFREKVDAIIEDMLQIVNA